MNTLGRIFRINIFGESHGSNVGICIDGCPAGLPITTEDFTTDIERRKGGTNFTTPRVEEDIPNIISGVFNNTTIGTPLTILFANNNVKSADYEKQKHTYRPGHADFVAAQKFGGYQDYRGSGHFSGRLTVCLVAAGVIAKKILSTQNRINIAATLIEVGGEKNIEAGLQKALDAKDSVGGIVECTITGLPIGLGEPFFDSVESLISHAVFAIPAIKGIEFGTGFKAATMFGSQHNDAIENASGKTITNNSGGINGGLTNGNDVVFRIAVKPTSSTPKEQKTYSNASDSIELFSVNGRHDLCIALRVPVVLEAVTAIVLADLLLLEQKVKRVC